MRPLPPTSPDQGPPIMRLRAVPSMPPPRFAARPEGIPPHPQFQTPPMMQPQSGQRPPMVPPPPQGAMMKGPPPGAPPRPGMPMPSPMRPRIPPPAGRILVFGPPRMPGPPGAQQQPPHLSSTSTAYLTQQSASVSAPYHPRHPISSSSSSGNSSCSNSSSSSTSPPFFDRSSLLTHRRLGLDSSIPSWHARRLSSRRTWNLQTPWSSVLDSLTHHRRRR